MTQRTWLPWGLVGMLAVLCALLVWRPWNAGDSAGPKAADCRPEIDEQISEAQDLQVRASKAVDGDEQAQRKAWEEVLAEWNAIHEADELCSRQEEIVRRNRDLAERKLKAIGAPTAWERPEGDNAGAPKIPAPREDFLAYYPVGKTVHSTAQINVNGRGESRRWVLEGTAYFAYQYLIVAETKVVENGGSFAVFEIKFHTVEELRAVSREEVRLAAPDLDSPVLAAVWDLVKEEGLRKIPGYTIVKRIGQAIEAIDPEFKGTLTWLNARLKEAGYPQLDREDIEIASQVRSLAGTTLRATYARDLGVAKFQVIEGPSLTQDELRRAAYHASLLMDYYVFPSRERHEGESWDVHAVDVSRMVSVDFDAQASGAITLKHIGAKVYEGEDCIQLSVAGGDVQLVYDMGGKQRATTITPQTGNVIYSPQDLLVRKAYFKWKASALDVPSDHLLFGLEKTFNVEVESAYEARLGSRAGEAPATNHEP